MTKNIIYTSKIITENGNGNTREWYMVQMGPTRLISQVGRAKKIFKDTNIEHFLSVYTQKLNSIEQS